MVADAHAAQDKFAPLLMFAFHVYAKKGTCTDCKALYQKMRILLKGAPQLPRLSSHSNPTATQYVPSRSLQICSASYEDYAGGGPQRPAYAPRGGYGGRGGGGQRTQVGKGKERAALLIS
eukprot:1158109-Pelagomonas_calceolata.AAC.11